MPLRRRANRHETPLPCLAAHGATPPLAAGSRRCRHRAAHAPGAPYRRRRLEHGGRMTLRDAFVQLVIILWLIPALDALNRFSRGDS
jgi:hypothetical protein